MSTHTVEKVLWELGSDPDKAAEFRQACEKFLALYRLADEERQMLQEFDLRGMAERGVSTLLLMSAWMAVHGPATMKEYIARMNQPHT